MPESNGLKQVLDSVLVEGEGKRGDDVAVKEEARPDDVSSMVKEFEEPSPAQVSERKKSERVESSDGDYVENGPSDERLTEDGDKEDMFVDCPEDTEQSSEDNDDMMEVPVYELVNGTVIHSAKEESESLFEDLSNLLHQLKSLSNQQPLNNENEDKVEIGKSLSIHDKANECSKLVKNALDEKLRMEEEFKKLHSSIVAKDQEIEHLQIKVSELSLSQNVVLSFFSSQNQSLSDPSNPSVDVQYGLQSVDDSVNRVLASLAMSVSAEGLSDESLTGRMLFLEQNVSQLIGNYQYLLSEIELLRQTLSEVVSEQQDFWTATTVSRTVLLELKQKEVGFGQHVGNLEEENKNLKAEVEKLTKELELEKVRFANTKEKLSMAVTKGKALVQQRDSLKQSLAEKTEELARTENLVASLQETLSQRDNILSKCQEILYQTSLNHELESVDIMERIKSLVGEKKEMERAMLEFNKLGDVLACVNFPENLPSSDLKSRVSWLLESFLQAEGEVGKLKDEISRSRELADLFVRMQTKLYIANQELVLCTELLEEDAQIEAKMNSLVNELGTVRKELELLKDEKSALERELERSDEKASLPREKLSMAVKKGKGLVQDRDNLKKVMDEKGAEIEKLNCTLHQHESMVDDLKNQISKLSIDLDLIPKLEADLRAMKDQNDQQQQFLVESNNMVKTVMESIDGLVPPVDVAEPIDKVLWFVRYVDECRDAKTVLEQDLGNLKVEFDSLSSKLSEAYAAKSSLEEAISAAESNISRLGEENRELAEISATRKSFEDALLEAENKISVLVDEKSSLEEALSSAESSISKLSEENRKIAEISASRKSLEDALLEAENKISVLVDEKSSLEEALSAAECSISRLNEEKRELAEICANKKSFEDALIEAENKILVLTNEKSSLEEALSTAENRIFELGEKKRELAETCASRKSLEDALLDAQNKISVLINEKSSLQKSLSTVENSIFELGEEKELADIRATRKSLEDELLEAQNKISVLINERNDAQICKASIETELEKVKEEVSTQTSRLAEAYRTINSLEGALSHLETNVSLLSKENNEAQVGRSNLEDEMKKLREEAESHASKFVDATSIIRSLEDNKSKLVDEKKKADEEILILKEVAESWARKYSDITPTIRSLEDNVSKLLGEKKKADEEILILKEEAESWARKYSDITSTIRSLEDELSKLMGEKRNAEEEISMLKIEAESQATKLSDATSTIRSVEDDLSKLAGEKKNSEEEISLLNSKLSMCMEELAGLGGNLENRSLELSSHLQNLHLILEDETLFTLLRQSFEVKFQSLRDMDLLLREIKDNLAQVGSDSLPSSPGIEVDSLVNKFSASFDNAANIGIDKGDDDSEGSDGFESYFRRIVEGMQRRNTTLADKVQGSSTSVDKFIAALLKNFRETRDEIMYKLDELSSLEQKLNDLETDREARELKVARLENDVKVLFSACTVTAQELENKAESYQGDLSTVPELENRSNLLAEVRGDTVTGHELETSRCVKPAEDLLVAAQKVCALTRVLEREKNLSGDTIQVLENKLTESKAAAEKAIEERDLLQAKVSKLEIDLKKMQSSHQEMSSKVEDYRSKETTLSDREAEISSLRKSLTIKEKEAENALLVASQVKSLCDKINDLETPFMELKVEDTEFHGSDPLKKLFYVVEAVTLMRQQINTLTQDKEKLQSTVDKQAHQKDNLVEEIDEKVREKEDLEKMKNEIFDVELGMENIITKLGGNVLVENHKADGIKELFSVLDKLVTEIILEYDNTKSKAQELAIKLHGSQASVDELSAKIKLLELSSQDKPSSSSDVVERSIFEAPPLPTRSDITELEDVELLGKKVVGQASSAPHARPLRKGSNDHLAINIDSESDSLIKNEKSDEDKGKVFKSLTTSGLIPRQGKLFADRLDGYWVSGDRALMSRPRARLSLIAYWLLLHIWLLGTIL